jgi:hypothetical protein
MSAENGFSDPHPVRSLSVYSFCPIGLCYSPTPALRGRLWKSFKESATLHAMKRRRASRFHRALAGWLGALLVALFLTTAVFSIARLVEDLVTYSGRSDRITLKDGTQLCGDFVRYDGDFAAVRFHRKFPPGEGRSVTRRIRLSNLEAIEEHDC